MGIFDTAAPGFTTYQARLRFRNWICGGVPRDSEVIAGWLRAKAGITDEMELRSAVLRTLGELGNNEVSSAEYEAALGVAIADAEIKQTVGFKVLDSRRYIEDRQVKAMLKEVVNILYAGDKWGRTKKGPLSYFAERVFIDPEKIFLDDPKEVVVEPFIGHITDRQGPRSTLTHVERALQPTVSFRVKVATGAVEQVGGNWPAIWVHAQEIGLGALRSQSFGRFDIEQWDPI